MYGLDIASSRGSSRVSAESHPHHHIATRPPMPEWALLLPAATVAMLAVDPSPAEVADATLLLVLPWANSTMRFCILCLILFPV